MQDSSRRMTLHRSDARIIASTRWPVRLGLAWILTGVEPRSRLATERVNANCTGAIIQGSESIFVIGVMPANHNLIPLGLSRPNEGNTAIDGNILDVPFGLEDVADCVYVRPSPLRP